MTKSDVTRLDADRLWSSAIAGTETLDKLGALAAALIERVNSENPVVNWGLLDFYYLSRPGAVRDPDPLIANYGRWRAQLADFDADPSAWMRSYFRTMLTTFACDHGEARARTFGAKLVARGHLTDGDVDNVLLDHVHRSGDH